MTLNDLLKANDWPIKKFLVVVFSIHLALWGVIISEELGFTIPVIRQVVGFVYLSFIPGIIILRILRLHNLGSVKTLIYSVGLSVATVMFTGVLINVFYPSFGILEPMSTIPLMISFTVLSTVFCFVASKRDAAFFQPTCVVNLGPSLVPSLFLCLLPALSILGVQLVNLYNENILLMVLVIVISFTFLLIGFNKFVPKNLYPFALFTLALSLLLHRSLLSQYISGFDIHEEYYVANLVVKEGIWDSANPMMVNGMLSISMIAPVVSSIAAIDLTWVFKVCYPVLFALVPLGLYHIFKRQSDEKIAFFGVGYFISIYQFYIGMPTIPRQQIATFFFVCLVVLMIDNTILGRKRAFFLVVFGASLVVSHYGLSYIVMFYLCFAWLILVLGRNQRLTRIWGNIITKIDCYLGNTRQHINKKSAFFTINAPIVTLPFVELFIIFVIVWYYITSNSMVFEGYVGIFQRIVNNFTKAFLDPEASYGLTMVLTRPKPGLLHWFDAIINYLNQIFIILGLLSVLLKFQTMKFVKEYVIFSVLSLAILFAGVLVPFLTITASMERLYITALVFLAPFVVLGMMTAVRTIDNVMAVVWKNKKSLKQGEFSAVNMFSIYLVLFFLFQTQFIWQVTEQQSKSVSLSQASIKEIGTMEEKARLYSNITPEQDIFGAEWLSQFRDPLGKIYATFSDAHVHALTSYGMIPKGVQRINRGIDPIPLNAYIYLQYINVFEGIATEFDSGRGNMIKHAAYSMSELDKYFIGKNLIYANGGSEIYRY